MRKRGRHRASREGMEGGGRRIYDPRRWHTPTSRSSSANARREGEAPAGWVLVWAGRFKRWRRRWFVLHTAGLLHYYKSSDQIGRPGCINLLDAQVVPDCAKSRQLKIIRGPIIYYLRTTNREFRKGWLDAIYESVRIYNKSLANANAGALPNAAESYKTSREECEEQERELSMRLEQRLHDIEPACQEFLDKLHGLQESLIVISEALDFSSSQAGMSTEHKSAPTTPPKAEHRLAAHRSLFGRRGLKPGKDAAQGSHTLKHVACKRPVEAFDVDANDGTQEAPPRSSKKRNSHKASVTEKKVLQQGPLHAAWINLRSVFEEALKDEIGRVIELEAENMVLQESLGMLPQLRKDRQALLELREKLKNDGIAYSQMEKRSGEQAGEDSDDEISMVGTDMTHEEYYEALEVLNQHEFIARSSAAEEQEICADDTQEPPEECELEISEAEAEESEQPRTRLPAPRPLSMGFSLWTVLKNAIGKDLNHITMPATINEPLSALQRCAEQMQFRNLLHMAAEQTSSMQRLLLVSSFACASYNGSIIRDAKPFNPILGETYEWQAPDGTARFLSEQVSHHPPVMAFQGESTKGDYTIYGEIEIRSKFWGKSVEVLPLGSLHVQIPKFDDHFTWSQVSTCIHNVVVGKPWIDSYGEMTVKNHSTKEYARIRFHKANSREQGVLSGKAYDAQGNALFVFHGNFMDTLCVSPEPSSPEDGAVRCCLWKSPPPPQDHRQQYFFSEFAIGLNELTSRLAVSLPPTDSRFRPDQRALEDGDLEKATPEKFRLEEKQRRSRKLAKEQGVECRSRWFHQSTPGKVQVQADDNLQPNWRFNGLYWQHREKQDWEICPDIM